MICLDNTDTLEGGASVTNVVDYTVHGLVAGVFTNLAIGQLSSTNPSVLYTAGAAISLVSVTFVNTHSAAVTVDLYLDPANAGTPRRMIPKALVLGVGHSMHFDGARCTITTVLGSYSPPFRFKKITGTTHASEGGAVTIAHGLTFSKIIGASVAVIDSAGSSVYSHQATMNAGTQFDFYVGPENVVIANHATNSENILSKDIVAIIFYEE